jgi:type II secretory pathway pseudopilin PulG
LVSLAVLGLIAGLTVPSIVVSVERSKNKALLKESIQVIREVLQNGVLNGDFASMASFDIQSSTSPLIQYFSNKFNGVQCPMGTIAPPCNHNWNDQGITAATNNHSGRWVLPNGVKIWIGDALPSSTYINFIIDVKPDGISKAGVIGGDQIGLVCNLSDTTSFIAYSDVALKSAECGPGMGYPLNRIPYNALFE